MDREQVKKLIPLYIENELETIESNKVRDFLAKDPELQKYALDMQKSWDLIAEDEGIQPQDGYVSKFWTRLSAEKSLSEKAVVRIKEVFAYHRFTPAFVAVCLILMVASVVLNNQNINQPENTALSNLTVEEIEMIQEIELVENLEILQDLELFEEIETIQIMEELKISYAS